MGGVDQFLCDVDKLNDDVRLLVLDAMPRVSGMQPANHFGLGYILIHPLSDLVGFKNDLNG